MDFHSHVRSEFQRSRSHLVIIPAPRDRGLDKDKASMTPRLRVALFALGFVCKAPSPSRSGLEYASKIVSLKR